MAFGMSYMYIACTGMNLDFEKPEDTMYYAE